MDARGEGSKARRMGEWVKGAGGKTKEYGMSRTAAHHVLDCARGSRGKLGLQGGQGGQGGGREPLHRHARRRDAPKELGHGHPVL
jgi:hypothetical protein